MSAQENEFAASLVCDDRIRQWLFNRNKFSSQKRKRGAWIRKLNARRNQHLTPTTNTPKRSTNAPRRSTRSSGVIIDNVEVFSPVAKSMFKTPVVKHVKKNVQRQANKKKPKNTKQVCFLFASACLCFNCLFALLCRNICGNYGGVPK